MKTNWFDKKVLIGKKSKLYKRRQLMRSYIIDWNEYTQEEQELIVKNIKQLLTDRNIKINTKGR